MTITGLPISHCKESMYFNLRTCGIAIHDGRILGVKIAPYDFWLFPGGRIEYMESSEEALRREIFEELQTPCQIVKLLWHIEDFYHFEGEATHELCYYYQIEFPPESPIYQKKEPWSVFETAKEHEERKTLTFHWIPLSTLSHVQFIPQYITAQLGALPSATTFLIMNHIKKEETKCK